LSPKYRYQQAEPASTMGPSPPNNIHCCSCRLCRWSCRLPSSWQGFHPYPFSEDVIQATTRPYPEAAIQVGGQKNTPNTEGVLRSADLGAEDSSVSCGLTHCSRLVSMSWCHGPLGMGRCDERQGIDGCDRNHRHDLFHQEWAATSVNLSQLSPAGSCPGDLGFIASS
jgi:hypothetical protein